MTDNSYQKALDDAANELGKLLAQKDVIEKRIAKLKQTLVALRSLNEIESESDDDDQVYIPSALERAAGYAALAVAGSMVGKNVGFTDVCRDVLKASGEFMTPVEVKEGIIRMGINLESKYSNSLAVIHTTLRRLVGNDEVEVGRKDGKAAFRWKVSMRIGGNTYSLKARPEPGREFPTFNPKNSPGLGLDGKALEEALRKKPSKK